MKRGLLILAFLLLCTYGAAAETVGTYDKPPATNWSVDGHQLMVIQREAQQEDTTYLRFANDTLEMTAGDCIPVHNYEVCFNSSELGLEWDPETRTTPYIYTFIITADVAEIKSGVARSPGNIIAGEYASVTLTVNNTGDYIATDVNVTVDLKGAEVRFLKGPCEVKDIANKTVLYWHGDIQDSEDAGMVCTFEARAMATTTLKPDVRYFDGRKMTTNSGGGAVFDIGPVVKVFLMNSTIPLGKLTSMVIALTNEGSEKIPIQLDLSSDRADLSNNTIRAEIASNESRNFTVTIMPRITPNASVRIDSSWVIASTKITDLKRINITVVPPEVELRTFGNQKIDVPGMSRLSVDVHNKADITMYNATVFFVAPTLQFAEAPVITLLPGKLEQAYISDIKIPFNNAAELVWMTFSYDTEFGQHISSVYNVTFTSGTPTKAPAKTQKPAADAPAPKPTPANTTAPIAKPVEKEPVDILHDKTTLYLAFVVLFIGIVGALWVFANMRKGAE